MGHGAMRRMERRPPRPAEETPSGSTIHHGLPGEVVDRPFRPQHRGRLCRRCSRAAGLARVWLSAPRSFRPTSAGACAVSPCEDLARPRSVSSKTRSSRGAGSRSPIQGWWRTRLEPIAGPNVPSIVCYRANGPACFRGRLRGMAQGISRPFACWGPAGTKWSVPAKRTEPSPSLG